jgi:hypothetical protein
MTSGSSPRSGPTSTGPDPRRIGIGQQGPTGGVRRTHRGRRAAPGCSAVPGPARRPVVVRTRSAQASVVWNGTEEPVTFHRE